MARIEFTISGEDPSDYTTTNPYGIVLILNYSEIESKTFTTLPLLVGVSVIVAAVVAVGLGVTYHFKKQRH
jgi:hypothetical protein